MNLRDYVRAVRKRWWLVVGATLLALGCAVIVTATTPPTYAANLTFFVSTDSTGIADAYTGNMFSQQRVKSYVDVLTSDRLAQNVVNDAGVALTPAQFQSEVSATAVLDTVLLRVTITDRHADRALSLAQHTATDFTSLVQVLETPVGKTTPTVHVEVIEGPKVSSTPVAPKPTLNLGLGLLLGILAGIGGAALRESLDTTVKTTSALEQLTGAPVLSALPFDARAKKAPLIIEGSARSARAEAMRQLRTNLQFANVDKPPRTLVVTSALPDEGKTTTACNLAIVFAEAGSRVLLIDADLRRPRVADYLDLEGGVGLTNVLAGQVGVDDAIQEWGKTGIHVLPSGSVPPNPSELLNSRQMTELLASLRTGFDAVIIDTPPLLPFTDAAVAASRVDGTILVTRCEKTTAAQARQAAQALASVGAPVLGSVLNMAPGKTAAAYSYYNYRYSTAPDAQTDTAEAARTTAQPVVVSQGGEKVAEKTRV